MTDQGKTKATAATDQKAAPLTFYCGYCSRHRAIELRFKTAMKRPPRCVDCAAKARAAIAVRSS